MNYLRIHDAILNNAKSDHNRSKENGYYENHHIIPKCMGGSDERDNLILLTASEHYVVHQLLCKIHPDNSHLIFAANMLTVAGRDNVRNNKQYSWVRKRMSIAMSEIANNGGENNPMYGKKHSEKSKAKMSANRRGTTLSDEHKAIVSSANKNKIVGEETRKKIGDYHRGKTVSQATREKLSKSNKGQKRNVDFCKKRSEYTSGERNPMYGNGHKISGEKNGMFGKSAVKGRSWYYHITESKAYLLSDDEILKLDNDWRKGRI